MLFHVDRRTDGRTYMPKLIVAFRNFVKPPQMKDFQENIMPLLHTHTQSRNDYVCCNNEIFRRKYIAFTVVLLEGQLILADSLYIARFELLTVALFKIQDLASRALSSSHTFLQSSTLRPTILRFKR